MTFRVFLCLTVGVCAFAADRNFVMNPNAQNTGLLVGVSHGLPGLNYDIKNISDVAGSGKNQIEVEQMNDSEGTVDAVAKKLTERSAKAGMMGTFLFYFTGHGNKGIISMQDRSMKIGEIRTAIEKGRQDLGPIGRLILLFDSCYSGSLLDPIRQTFAITERDRQAEDFANSVLQEFDTRESRNYWYQLIVVASSRADETSLAGNDGSEFTKAFRKAYDEVSKDTGTIGDLIKKTQGYTQGHHPVARLVPTSLEAETL